MATADVVLSADCTVDVVLSADGTADVVLSADGTADVVLSADGTADVVLSADCTVDVVLSADSLHCLPPTFLPFAVDWKGRNSVPQPPLNSSLKSALRFKEGKEHPKAPLPQHDHKPLKQAPSFT